MKRWTLPTSHRAMSRLDIEKRQYEIECGRCGATKQESVTEGEAKGITDRTAPVYRPCERCGKTTGWIESRSDPALAKETIV
ncbi:MAG: hypothetical protein L0229_12295 [Blastocatellia bacterium]|nr:hypothetical protein [Blastocatellia bacterium]